MKGQLRNLKSTRAFTLIELTMSIAIISILMLALGSTLRLTLYATSTAATASAQASRAAEVSDQLTADLGVAMNFTERTATAITFTVPDRDGDGAADQLRYALSGTSLTRQYKSNAAATIATGVSLFNLSYLVKTTPSAAATESALASFDSASASEEYKIEDNDAIAQYFVPTLPSGATTWSISRIRLRGKCEGGANDGAMYVQVRTAAASKAPTSVVLAGQTLYEVALCSGWAWVDVPISVSGLGATQGVCVVVVNRYGDKVGRFTGQKDSGTVHAGYFFTESSNSGSTWSTPTDKECMRFYVYGSTQ